MMLIYRTVGHWRGAATVAHDRGERPVRLQLTVVGVFGRQDGTDIDSGERLWSAETIGLPSGLAGQTVLVRFADEEPLPALE